MTATRCVRNPIRVCSCAFMVSFVTCLNAAPALPVVPAEIPPRIQILQPGVKLTLLAEHPDLRTPTGLDVDAQGNIWLVACHTHFRPRDYQGPKHDEILVFDRHGKNRRVFYQQTDATMQLKLGPDGWVYLAERSRILRVKDTDGDGAGDVEEKLAALDTVAEYPHNGLAGLAWHPDGGLLFSIGQNAAKDWTLTSKDGLTLAGRGEGGVFRCRADGTGLRRIARGFWNPFGLLVQRTGEIFAVDNDPGSRPPCRLLTIIEGADYGFQRVYGEAAVHPFVAWNGELRGTLGMIHPSGEGPSAVVELGAVCWCRRGAVTASITSHSRARARATPLSAWNCFAAATISGPFASRRDRMARSVSPTGCSARTRCTAADACGSWRSIQRRPHGSNQRWSR